MPKLKPKPNTQNEKAQPLLVVEKKKSTLNVSKEVHELITELLPPRAAQLRQIVWTKMVPDPRSDEDGDNDWWPDYAIYSPTHAFTDVKGLLCFTQGILKGLPEELLAIFRKFKAMYNKSKAGMDELNRSRYRVVLDVLKDLINFINNFNKQCDLLLYQRRDRHERATETRDTSDRIKLKVFDERAFRQLHSKMSNLKMFLHEFCDLFELGEL